jgi:hypothetical protein
VRTVDDYALAGGHSRAESFGPEGVLALSENRRKVRIMPTDKHAYVYFDANRVIDRSYYCVRKVVYYRVQMHR